MQVATIRQSDEDVVYIAREVLHRQILGLELLLCHVLRCFSLPLETGLQFRHRCATIDQSRKFSERIRLVVPSPRFPDDDASFVLLSTTFQPRLDLWVFLVSGVLRKVFEQCNVRTAIIPAERFVLAQFCALHRQPHGGDDVLQEGQVVEAHRSDREAREHSILINPTYVRVVLKEIDLKAILFEES